MNKKVVVLGGGTGLSVILRGLKLFPIDITAIVTVSDDGGSTGELRKNFNIPALGDLRKVLVALSETEPLVEDLLQYRFKKVAGLKGHPTGNLLLAALLDITGNLADAVEALSKVLNIKGTILPLTEDKSILVAETKDGKIIEGESSITKAGCEINTIKYKEKPEVTKEAITAIEEADLVVMGIGSLYTSVIPNLLCPEICDAIKASAAKKLFISNIMTQHGETDKFKVSDFIKIAEQYVGDSFIDAIIVNNGRIDNHIKKRYAKTEKSTPVIFDKKNVEKYNAKIIEEDLVDIVEEKDWYNPKRTDKMIRHNSMKLSLLIFTYLISKKDN